MENNKKKILIVEDESIIALNEQHDLEKYGYAVKTVNKSSDAIDVAINDANVDLVLMDINLENHVDGTEAALEILKERDIPIIFLSSHTEKEIVEKTEKITSYGYVVKNSGIFVLDAAIKMAFKLHHAKMKRIESENKFLTAFMMAPYVLLLTKPDGTIVEVNDIFEKLSGYTKDDVRDKTITSIDFWANVEDRNWVVNELQSGKKVEDKEFRFKRKNGEAYEGLFYARMIKLCGEDIILTSIKDITKRKIVEANYQMMFEKQETILQGIVRALSLVVDTRDSYTAGHQLRVAQLAKKIAEKKGLSKDEIQGIVIAASIHDIGKLGVPSELLSKPSALSKAEFELIKVHPKDGYDILKNIDFPWPIADMVYQHHEKIDGSGYPQRLFDGEILLGARILMISDVVEAIASHRPYRPALGIGVAIDELERWKGIKYDEDLADICIKLFKDEEFHFN